MAYNDPDKGKKYDLEDLRKTPNPFYIESGKKADNGYSFVKTPSPAPGVDESPFMTWGEIDGTPLRLDPDETPGGSERSHFKIPPPPVRDVKAHVLSRDAAKRIKARTNMFHKPPLASPARGGSASPRTLSPAAQKFVRNAIAKSTRTIDESLRASYRGSTHTCKHSKDEVFNRSRPGITISFGEEGFHPSLVISVNLKCVMYFHFFHKMDTCSCLYCLNHNLYNNKRKLVS
ncbi:hypothetical protein ACQ4PT_018823 [Festuca glaucescens]